MKRKSKAINYDKRFTIRLSSELVEYYSNIANKKNITISEILRQILEDYKKTLDDMSDIYYN